MEFDAECGSDLVRSVRKAISIAKKTMCIVEFAFNYHIVRVDRKSDPRLVIRDYQRPTPWDDDSKTIIGPEYKPMLSKKEISQDELTTIINELHYEKEDAAHAEKRDVQPQNLNGLLSKSDPLDIIDQAAWDDWESKNTDAYGSRVFSYAKDWGRLMQARMSQGESMGQCAVEMSKLADHDGITGFMFGAACSVLGSLWRHGEELKELRSAGKV